MKRNVHPAVVWGSLGVVVAIVIAVGYFVIAGPGFRENKVGSEKDIQRVKSGDTFYKPPANAPVPGKNKPGVGSPSTTPGGGMYNLTPPPR